jgi:hypothetical protein
MSASTVSTFTTPRPPYNDAKSMKSMSIKLISVLFVVLGCEAFAQSSINAISFQGALTSLSGQPLANGTYGLSFRFYDVPTNGTAFATSSIPNVAVVGGIASLSIPSDPGWFDGSTKYLGITIDAGTELAPRVLITSVPMAAYAHATRGLFVNPPVLGPPAMYLRPTNRVVLGSTLETISRIPPVDEALVIGTSNSAAGASAGIFFDTLSRADSAIIVEKNNNDGSEDNTMRFYVGKDGEIASKIAMSINQNGRVGIGTPGAIYQRLIVGTSDGDADRMPQANEVLVIGTTDNSAGAKAAIYFDSNNRNGGGIIMEKVTGGSVDDHRMRFYVTKDGDPSSHNYMTIYENGIVEVPVLKITGGADLAEHVTVAAGHSETQVGPGMVVSIDPAGIRKFKLSDEAYDRKRVGIISGGNGVKPGLLLQDDGNAAVMGEQPIALAGQVWCCADASFGSIGPGDLLTTSTTSGHAMKVTDLNRARFAVLGQALTELKRGRGWVQVLVRAE